MGGGGMMSGRLQLKVMETAERAKPVLRFLPVGDQNLKKVITGVLEHLKLNLALNLHREKH